MKSITSRDNPLYKELKHLATSSQARRKSGRSVLEGIHLCEAYLQYVGMPLLCVIGEGACRHPEAAMLLARCEQGGASCLTLPDALFHALSQVENGVDLLFTIVTPQPVRATKLTNEAVLLDNLQDPGNLGSILRSAAAAGIREVFCSPGTASAWSPKVLRSAMGAHFLLRIFEDVDLLPLVRDAKLSVLATSSHAQRNLYQLDLSQPAAWLFGHEGQGVAAELLALATHQIAIPHLGDIESLNVAASAAVCFFEQVRQRLSEALFAAAIDQSGGQAAFFRPQCRKRFPRQHVHKLVAPAVDDGEAVDERVAVAPHWFADFVGLVEAHARLIPPQQSGTRGLRIEFGFDTIQAVAQCPKKENQAGPQQHFDQDDFHCILLLRHDFFIGNLRAICKPFAYKFGQARLIRRACRISLEKIIVGNAPASIGQLYCPDGTQAISDPRFSSRRPGSHRSGRRHCFARHEMKYSAVSPHTGRR